MTGVLASLAVFWWAVQFISERSVVFFAMFGNIGQDLSGYVRSTLRRFSTKSTAVRVAPVGDINSIFGTFVKDT